MLKTIWKFEKSAKICINIFKKIQIEFNKSIIKKKKQNSKKKATKFFRKKKKKSKTPLKNPNKILKFQKWSKNPKAWKNLKILNNNLFYIFSLPEKM